MDFNLPINISGVGSSAQQVSVDLALGSLPAEDSFSARVIFVSQDSVHLKLDDGSVLKARFEGGALPTLGSVITLETVERSDESVVLRIAEFQGGLPTEMGDGRVISDTVLQNLAQQLQNPELTPQQKIDLLMQMLFQQAPGAEQVNPEQILPGQTANPAPPLNPEAQMGQMLSELLGLLAEAIPEGEQAAPPTATVITEQPALAQQPQTAESAANPPQNANLPQDAPLRLLTAALFSLLDPGNPPPTEPTATPAQPQALPPGEQPLPQPAENLPQQAPTPATTPEARPELDLVSQLQQLPQAEELPPQKVQEFVDLAREIVQELRPQEGQQLAPKQVQEFVEKLFTQGSERSPEAAGMLKKAVRELGVRLAFLEEAIERSSLGNKNELLAQLQRLTTHSESLRQPDRYLYAQIPVYFEQERKTAELYVYRRREGKNGGRIDPQNATILLALNTQHLGRVETFVQFKAKEISLKMEIARHEAVPFVQEKSVSLYGLLTEAGYKLTSSNILPLKQKTNPDNAEQALTEFSGSFGRPYQVDVKI